MSEPGNPPGDVDPGGFNEGGLAAALHAFQGDAPALQRDKINPHFKSAYLSLEALLEEVLPVLHKHDLAITQWPTFIESSQGTLKPALRTRLVHGPSGEWHEDTMLLFPVKDDPQGQGGALTYGRRYAIMAALGLSADVDDDAQKPASRTRRAPGKISEKQRAELFEAVRAAGLPTDRAKAIVKEIAGVDDTADIPSAKFRDTLRAIKAAKA